MAIEWLLPWLKPASSALFGAKSFYDRARHRHPTADFVPSADGVLFHLRNVRPETIIIEHVQAIPNLLAFARCDHIDDDNLGDMVEAIVRRQGWRENALLALTPNEENALQVILAGEFQQERDAKEIRVTVWWRTSSRSMFSKSKFSKKTTVGDIKELRRESEKRRGRPMFGSLPL
jgi:hypothetical protein